MIPAWRLILPDFITRHMNPLYMPAWPRWIGQGSEAITIRGRHLTPTGLRLAKMFGAWAGRCFVFGLIWDFYFRSPLFAIIPVHYVLGLWGINDGEGVYFVLWFVFFLSTRAWSYLFIRVLEVVFRKCTTVRFTCDMITLYVLGFPARIPRLEGLTITIMQIQHPAFHRWVRKLQRIDQLSKRDLRMLKFYENACVVAVQYGQNLIPVASFVDYQKANQFALMCNVALQETANAPLAAFAVEPDHGIAMLLRYTLVAFAIGCVCLCGRATADTTVGDFEALDHEQRVARLTELTSNTLDKIATKNPALALKIQEYFITPGKGEKYGSGAIALQKQILEYDRINPKGYTIENALAKVLSDYLAGNGPTTHPTTQPTTRP